MKLERILWIIIIIGILIFHFTKPPGAITNVVEIPGDSIPYEVLIPYDSLIYDTITEYNTDTLWLHDTVFTKVDTQAILADYFKMVSYDSINIVNDSSMEVWADMLITQNRLYSIKGYGLNKRKTTIINNYQPKNQIGIGAMVGTGLSAPIASYQFGIHEVKLGYNFDKNNTGVVLGYTYKIPLKK